MELRAITMNPQHDVENLPTGYIRQQRDTHSRGEDDIVNVAPVHHLPYPAPHMTGHLKAALILDNDLQSFCLIMWQRI